MSSEKLELLQLRIFTSGNTLLAYLTSKEIGELEAHIISGKKEWITIADRRGHIFKINPLLVGGLETIQTSEKKKKKKSIPIKTLAEFAGVHPLTINRNFAGTLQQSADSKTKYSRATEETALALRDHLLRSERHSKKVPSEDAFLALFGVHKKPNYG